MLLTRGQLDYINKRRDEIELVLKHKPQEGWIALRIEWNQLNNLMKLHNIAVREKTDASTTNSTDS